MYMYNINVLVCTLVCTYMYKVYMYIHRELYIHDCTGAGRLTSLAVPKGPSMAMRGSSHDCWKSPRPAPICRATSSVQSPKIRICTLK